MFLPPSPVFSLILFLFQISFFIHHFLLSLQLLFLQLFFPVISSFYSCPSLPFTSLSSPNKKTLPFFSILYAFFSRLIPHVIPCPPCPIRFCYCPSLSVTIAAVPTIHPLFPVAGPPHSPWRSLAPLLQRTAGRRYTAPLPPSQTGRGNESPRQLCTACVCVRVHESDVHLSLCAPLDSKLASMHAKQPYYLFCEHFKDVHGA